MMRISHVRSLTFAVFLMLLIQVARAQGAVTEAQLVGWTQELYAGVDHGDPTAWKKYIAADCLYFDEKGRNMTKAALVADITPFAKGFSGQLRLGKVQSHIEGNVAILSFDLDESEIVFGQAMTARYHETDTWMLRNGQWQIVAGQVLRYYEDPAPGKTDTTQYASYSGTYELAPDTRLTVSTDGKSLYRQLGDSPRVELFPESGDVYFRKGAEGRQIFRRGPDGKIDALIDRRNNEDIVWTKVG
jgi:hypothetical protein